MPKASKLAVGPGGKLHSKKSKTGDPKCSAAVSEWVRGRKTGSVAASVYATLAKCRSKSRQNKSAAAKQASGKLAEGRGTWQRSEKAAQLRQERSAKVPTAHPSDAVARAKAAVQAAREHSPASPVAPRPAGLAPGEKGDRQIMATIHKAIRNPSSIEGGPGHDSLVAIHKLRDHVDKVHGDVGDRFDRVLKKSRSEGKTELIAVSDNRKLTPAQLDRSIPGMNETIAYAVRPDRSAAADLVAQARAVHAANPGPEMTTHAPHATNASKAKPSPKQDPDTAAIVAAGHVRRAYRDAGSPEGGVEMAEGLRTHLEPLPKHHLVKIAGEVGLVGMESRTRSAITQAVVERIRNIKQGSMRVSIIDRPARGGPRAAQRKFVFDQY